VIPPNLDYTQIIRDLNALGWRDYKIEIACGWTKGYVSQVKAGNMSEMFYPRAARLYNFWHDELARSQFREALPINRFESTLESA
jgi:hypothetical protein